VEDVRVQKLKEIESLGVNPYPTFYRYTHTVDKLVAEFSPKSAEELTENKSTVRIGGRILASRPFGKAGFLSISDNGARIQIYIRKDQVSEKDFQLYQLLDIGDFIGAEGWMFRTKTGELVRSCHGIEFLAKGCFRFPKNGMALPISKSDIEGAMSIW
jgi:lysyl-tRNA synthetase class 2